MKKTLLLITVTGALLSASAKTMTNYTDIHSIKDSKSNIIAKYIDIHDISNSKAAKYTQK